MQLCVFRVGSGILALMLLATSLAGASSNQSRKWWHSEDFQRQLGLSAQQSEEIEAIFQASVPRLRALKAELDKAEAALSDLIAEARVEEAQVVRQIDRVEAIRSDLSRARTLMLFRMHRVLTPDQRAKLKDLHGEHHRRDSSGRGRP